MQESKQAKAQGSWLQLINTKEYMLFKYIFGNYSNVNTIMALHDDFMASTELRMLGINKVNVELVFHDIVECKDEGLYRFWKLTPLGAKIKEKLTEIISLLGEVI